MNKIGELTANTSEARFPTYLTRKRWTRLRDTLTKMFQGMAVI